MGSEFWTTSRSSHLTASSHVAPVEVYVDEIAAWFQRWTPNSPVDNNREAIQTLDLTRHRGPVLDITLDRSSSPIAHLTPEAGHQQKSTSSEAEIQIAAARRGPGGDPPGGNFICAHRTSGLCCGCLLKSAWLVSSDWLVLVFGCSTFFAASFSNAAILCLRQSGIRDLTVSFLLEVPVVSWRCAILLILRQKTVLVSADCRTQNRIHNELFGKALTQGQTLWKGTA